MNQFTLLLAFISWSSSSFIVSSETKTEQTKRLDKDFEASFERDLVLAQIEFAGWETTPPKVSRDWDTFDWLKMAETYWKNVMELSKTELPNIKDFSDLEEIRKVAIQVMPDSSCRFRPLLLETVCRVRSLTGQDLTDISDILTDPRLKNKYGFVVESCSLCLFNLLPKEVQSDKLEYMLHSMLRSRLFTADEIINVAHSVTVDSVDDYFLIFEAISHDRRDVFNEILNHYLEDSKIDYEKVFSRMKLLINDNGDVTESKLNMLDRYLQFVFRDDKFHEFIPLIEDIKDIQTIYAELTWNFEGSITLDPADYVKLPYKCLLSETSQDCSFSEFINEYYMNLLLHNFAKWTKEEPSVSTKRHEHQPNLEEPQTVAVRSHKRKLSEFEQPTGDGERVIAKEHS